MRSCPRCQSPDIHRSHPTLVERVVKHFTRKRPYRCRKCGWRGWGLHEPLEEYAWRGAPEAEASVLNEAVEDVRLDELDREQAK